MKNAANHKKLRAHVRGYGLALMMVMILSMVVGMVSLQMVVGTSEPRLMKAIMDKTAARTVALAALPRARAYIQTQLDAGTTVNQGSLLTNQTITVPNDPNNLSGGSSTTVGTYNVTVSRKNGNLYLIQVDATSGTSTDTETQLFAIKATPSASPIDTRFIGRAAGDKMGSEAHAVSGGDVDGDGYSDLVIGAEYAGSYSGDVYIIFGKSSGSWNSMLDASGNFSMSSALTKTNSVRFIGRNASDFAGVVAVGDVNGDSYADILIGASGESAGFAAGSYSGAAYLILGRSQANWQALTDASGIFNLDNLSDANLTVRFTARASGDAAGFGIAMVGDVDSDGIGDLLIGAPYNATGGSNAGEAYLIFGRSTANWAALTDASGNFSLASSSDANKMVRFIGRNDNGQLGNGVSGVGDADGDGIKDILLGAYDATNAGGSDAGEVFLILGRSTANWAALTDANGDFNLTSSSDANKMVRFIGRSAGDYMGISFAQIGSGDVDGDGYADVIMGAPWASGGATSGGESYLIMGRSAANWATLTDANGDFNLDNMSDANKTVRFLGRNSNDVSGAPACTIQDVNGDGIQDVFISASNWSGVPGDAYLIFGRSWTAWDALSDASGNFNLDNLSDANLTVRFVGRSSGDENGTSLRSVGDVNADGYNDLVTCANYADGGGADSGECYLMFGRSTANWAALTDASGNFSMNNI